MQQWSVECTARGRDFVRLMVPIVATLLTAIPPEPLPVHEPARILHRQLYTSAAVRMARSPVLQLRAQPTSDTRAARLQKRLNQVEVFFSLLQRRVLSRGVFSSTRVLIERILAYIGQFNQQGKRFHWTKTAEPILSSSTNVTAYSGPQPETVCRRTNTDAVVAVIEDGSAAERTAAALSRSAMAALSSIGAADNTTARARRSSGPSGRSFSAPRLGRPSCHRDNIPRDSRVTDGLPCRS